MGGSDSIYVYFDHFGASAGFFPHYVFFFFFKFLQSSLVYFANMQGPCLLR